MIDLTSIDKTKSADWIRLAELLLQKAVAAIQTPEKNALRDIQSDLTAFVQEATSKCPTDVLTAVNSAGRQVAAALLALDVADLATRSARLDAAGAKVAVAASVARSEAQKLQLNGVRQVLDELNGVASEVRQFRDQIASIPKKDIPAKLELVLDLLVKLEQRARATLATG